MAHYRLYLLDQNDRIVKGADIEASDDADACQLASAGLDIRVIAEIWCGARYIRRIVGLL